MVNPLHFLTRQKRKPISADTYFLGMLCGGLVIASLDPIAGASTAFILYQLYKARKAVEDAERVIKRAAQKQAFKDKFYKRQNFASYDDYLVSPEWRIKRAHVVQRAGGRCESPDCKFAVDEVHHKRYPRVWGNEPIDWLIGLCEGHHREAHNKQDSHTRP